MIIPPVITANNKQRIEDFNVRLEATALFELTVSSSEHNLKVEATLGYYSMSTRTWAFQLLRTVTGCSWKRTPLVLLPSGSTMSIFRAGSTWAHKQRSVWQSWFWQGKTQSAELHCGPPYLVPFRRLHVVRWSDSFPRRWLGEQSCVRKIETSSLA